MRRKKRERVRQLRELPRASVDFLQAPEEKENPQENPSQATKCEENDEAAGTEGGSLELESPGGDNLDSSSPTKEGNSQAKMPAVALAGSEESGGAHEVKPFCRANQASETGQHATVLNEWFLFKCVLNVRKEGEDFLVEMHWVEGQNRDLMNQLCTYLKNQIFRLVGT